MTDTPNPSATEHQLQIGQSRPGGPPPHKAEIPITLPLEPLLVGRAFVCGKSGSGKSNSASVLIEQILDAGRPLLVIDVEGEYYGLKEHYEVLHAGADDLCDIQVGPEHAEKIATLAIENGIPVIVDLSGFLDESTADALVGELARALFATAKQAREPFPVFLEECHEYIPQSGHAGEMGEAVVRIAKRGRKHGLGLVGISQRPASVEKDFITQCNVVVWHRLTWDTDTAVVKRVLGTAYAEAIEDLRDGEAFLVTDPDLLDGPDIQRVQFDRKQTYDAGAAPGLNETGRPDLKDVDETLVEELQAISERSRQQADERERLREQLTDREARIDALEADLAQAKDIRDLMGDMVGSLAGTGDGEVPLTIDGTDVAVPEVLKAEVMEIRDAREQAQTRADQRQQERDLHRRAAEHLASLLRERPLSNDVAALRAFTAEFEELIERHPDVLTASWDHSSTGPDDDARLRERTKQAEARVAELETALADAESVATDSTATAVPLADQELTSLLHHEAIEAAIETAIEHGSPASDHYDSVLAVLATAGDETYLSAGKIATPLSISASTVREVLKNLHTASVVSREQQTRGHGYALDRELLEQRIAVADRQAAIAREDATE
jgi:hypothetical protein